MIAIDDKESLHLIGGLTFSQLIVQNLINMILLAESLLHELIQLISEKNAEKNLIVRSQRTIEDITVSLQKLRFVVMERGFASQSDEIQFYKHILPRFYALYIYHATIYNFEADKPIGSNKSTKRYFRSELRNIENYFYHHFDLYKYYKSGRTNLDMDYFTRRKELPESILDVIAPLIDNDISTIYSIKVSFLLAYEQLKEYLQNSLLNIETPAAPTFEPEPGSITWTDSKVAFVELCYALHATGVFDNGKAGVQRITANLAHHFGLEVSNPSRVFQEILSRKKGRTVLLNRMILSTEQRMDREDM